ncbi:MAG: hypothetical protein NT090_05615, partial [Acidobacteria bacterium]|nr:hypothetical protein [Acidobacteriota bacterium]
MIQPSHGARFTFEALAEILSFGDMLGQDFDGDEAIEAGIAGLCTSPIPPAPIGGRTSQGPSLSPADSAIAIQSDYRGDRESGAQSLLTSGRALGSWPETVFLGSAPVQLPESSAYPKPDI